MRRRRLPRHALATLLLLVVALALGVAPGHAASPPHHRQLQRESDAAEPAIFEVADATLSAATTGCGLCQQTGYCDHAFKGSPGQFCLALASGLPCCCPQDAQCAANAYSCRCRRTNYYTNGHPPTRVVTRTTSTTTSDGAKSVSLFSLVAMLLCVGCCVCACCKRQQDERRDLAPAAAYQPVYASSQYGTTDQTPPAKYAYAYPSAPPPPDPYNAYNAPYATPAPVAASGGGYGNSYAAGAVGAVAGLAGGMLIGSALSGGGGGGGHTDTTTTTTTYFDGDSGFGNATSSYEFAGDGGDDGGDFGGDS